MPQYFSSLSEAAQGSYLPIHAAACLHCTWGIKASSRHSSINVAQ